MRTFIEIGGGSRKFSQKLVDLTRNDPIVERLPGYGLNNGSNFDISHKRQPARAPTVLFCVRYRKAELGFNMFIISHIAIACQDDIFTVVVYTM